MITIRKYIPCSQIIRSFYAPGTKYSYISTILFLPAMLVLALVFRNFLLNIEQVAVGLQAQQFCVLFTQ